jgi:hypothetical protein
MDNDQGYMLAFKGENGNISVEAFRDHDTAMAERQRAILSIRWPGAVSPPYVASSKQEAEERAKLYV